MAKFDSKQRPCELRSSTAAAAWKPASVSVAQLGCMTGSSGSSCALAPEKRTRSAAGAAIAVTMPICSPSFSSSGPCNKAGMSAVGSLHHGETTAVQPLLTALQPAQLGFKQPNPNGPTPNLLDTTATTIPSSQPTCSIRLQQRYTAQNPPAQCAAPNRRPCQLGCAAHPQPSVPCWPPHSPLRVSRVGG